jgi:hypothetical protein
MSEGEGVILGFDIRRGGEDEPFEDVRGRGYFRGGMDLFWNNPLQDIASFTFLPLQSGVK